MTPFLLLRTGGPRGAVHLQPDAVGECAGRNHPPCAVLIPDTAEGHYPGLWDFT